MISRLPSLIALDSEPVQGERPWDIGNQFGWLALEPGEIKFLTGSDSSDTLGLSAESKWSVHARFTRARLARERSERSER